MVGRDKKLQSLVKRREARAKQTAAYQQLQMEQNKRSYEAIFLEGTYRIFVINFFCKYQNFCLYSQTALMAVTLKKRNQNHAQTKL